MKLLKNQILILVAILLVVNINSYKVKSRSKVQMNLNNQSKNATAAAGNGTKAAAAPVNAGKPGSDVVGSANMKSRIEANPYTVTTCDQIIQFEAKTIDDMNNFAGQSPRYFTLNMYSIVQLKTKDIASFEKLLNVAALTNVPEIIQGSVSCLKFMTFDREVVICMPTAAEANMVLDAYKSFMKCRAGNDLKNRVESPQDKLKNMLNIGCLGLDISYDSAELVTNPAKAEASLNASIHQILLKMVKQQDQFLIDTSGKPNTAVGVSGKNKGQA